MADATVDVTGNFDSTQRLLKIVDNGDGTYSVSVSSTNLDIRDLTATDVVTANLSATDNAVLDDIAANQTDGTQATKLTDEYGFDIEGTPMGELRTVTPYRLVGANFDGTTVDANFWTATVANSATVAQANAQIVLTSGTNIAGSAKLNTTRRARYVSGTGMRFRAVVAVSAGSADNTRKWGIGWGATMPTITDGAYFQLSGTTFSIVTLKGTSATTVSSGSFNGTLGTTFAVGTGIRTYEIYWTNSYVYFVVGGSILHTVSASAATWADTMAHHVYMDNINSGNSTSVTLTCRVASIARLGPLLTQPISKYQSGTVAALVLKYGAGNLHGIVIAAVANTSAVTLWDNTAGSGTTIWASGAMGALTTPYFIDFKGLPFYTGLTLTIATANCSATVIYE